MPRVTVYIRNIDYEKWKLIENKSELISEAINRSVITSGKDDNYLEHHVVPPAEHLRESYAPTEADLNRMIKELSHRIEVLAESQDPEDQEEAGRLFDEKQALAGLLKGE